jgi:uncharacterized protein YjdB
VLFRRPRLVACAALTAWTGCAGFLLVSGCEDFGAPIVTGVVLLGPVRSDIQVDDVVQVVAEGRDAGGSGVRGVPLAWVSSDARVARVDGAGRVTGIAPGTAFIRATHAGIHSDPATVVVWPRVASVVVTAPAGQAATLRLGSVLAFAAAVRDAAGAAIPGAPLAWTSSDPEIARVDASGRAVALAEGATQVRAVSFGVQSAPFELLVVPSSQVPTTIAIVSPASPAEVWVRDAVQFLAEVRDQVGDPIPSPNVAWRSSDTLVATIDPAGLARGVAAGTAAITATTAGGSLQSAPVTLDVVLAPVGSVLITAPADPTVGIGQMVEFAALVRDPLDRVIPDAAVAWESQNTAVATIEATGTSTALARGITAGSANIVATSRGVSSPPVVLEVVQSAPSYSEIQPIWDQNCIGCHGLSGGLNLAAGASYDNLVNARSTSSALFRVQPGAPESSYLYIKLTGPCPSADCSGRRMPQGLPPLDPVLVERIRAWIASGAPR